MWRFDAQAESGGYRWRLMTSNGRPVATSHESFSSEVNARRSAGHFGAIASSWLYEVYAEGDGGYRWRAKAANGRTLAISQDRFESGGDAERAADEVRANAGRAKGA
jgi:uncharacterized protein YegP (UPF0339 family)